jgi:DNA-binding MarR family transcriptional regulator
MDILESKTQSESNHFTEFDVLSALEMFNDDYITFPIKTISELTGIRIDKNKRNYQSQKDHLEEARMIRDMRMKRQGKKWDDGNGRPKGSGTKEQLVKDYIAEHPMDNPTKIARALKISRPTVYKYMN